MSGLKDIRSRFENPDTNKPLPMGKPHIPVGNKNLAKRWDSGGQSKTSENNLSASTVANSVNPAREAETSIASNKYNSPNGPVGASLERDIKVGIPPIFQTPQTAPKPRPNPKPLVPKKTSDTNNNTRNDGQKDVASSGQRPVPKPAPFGREISADSSDEQSIVNGPSVTSARPTRSDNDSNTSGHVTSPRDRLPSMRAGSVHAMANMLGGKIPTNVSTLKAELKPVKASQPKTTVKPLLRGPVPGAVNEMKKHIQLRSTAMASSREQRKCVKSLIRKGDGNRYHKVDLDTLENSVSVVDKPSKLDISLDMQQLAKDFDSMLATLDGADHGWHEEVVEEEQEVYDDVGNVRPPSNRVSLIEPMTEDDEEQWQSAGFTGLPSDGPPKEKEVDDSMPPVPEDDTEEYYEPLPDEMDEPPSLPGYKPNVDLSTDTQTDTHSQTDAKELEKERKRKEKEEKKRQDQLEKEQKQKQRDLQQLLKKYKISEEELSAVVCKGTVKATKKAHKQDIAVTQGDKVDVIRMVDNQKGKWLIRITDTEKVGYVDAANIEVEPQIIRGAMEGSYAKHPGVTPTTPHPSAEDDVGGEQVYEDVDGDGTTDDLIEEEIYEECS